MGKLLGKCQRCLRVAELTDVRGRLTCRTCAGAFERFTHGFLGENRRKTGSGRESPRRRWTDPVR